MILLDNKHSYILHVGKISLMPGINEVDSEIWKSVQEFPLIKDRLDSNMLVIKANSEQYSKGLNSYDEKGALRLIKETFKKDMLSKWLEKEKRTRVISAINVQIKEISLESKTINDDADEIIR